ncbi:MAG: substrate-binding domain-containing protein [Bordetella sp.]
MATSLKILSGGAANGLVNALRKEFKNHTSFEIDGDFGAVGGMFDRVIAGESVDLVVLSHKLISDLKERALLLSDTCCDVGRVITGFAVPEGHLPPRLGSLDEVRTALLESKAIYTADTKKATAGIHFQSVLEKLEIFNRVERNLCIFPNGQTAMAEMARQKIQTALGCTQVTEILNTPGVRWVGALPEGLDLTTIYSVGIHKDSQHKREARALIELLTSPDHDHTRRSVGFS